MRKKKTKLLVHARHRLDRLEGAINLNKLMEMIISRNPDVYFVKRCTHTRSILYTKIDNIPVKFIYNRDYKLIITFLPMDYEYETDWIEITHMDEFGIQRQGFLHDIKCRIKIFPDCYKESHNKKMMTQFQIYDLESKTWMIGKKRGMLFEGVFDIVWNQYLNHKEG